MNLLGLHEPPGLPVPKVASAAAPTAEDPKAKRPFLEPEVPDPNLPSSSAQPPASAVADPNVASAAAPTAEDPNVASAAAPKTRRANKIFSVAAPSAAPPGPPTNRMWPSGPIRAPPEPPATPPPA